MSFFIRAGGKGKRGKGKGFVAHDPNKHKKRRREEGKLQNVEISSDEEEGEEEKAEEGMRREEEEELHISAQDKKVLLTKKYLAYLEEEGEEGGDRKETVLSKLTDELLEQTGKLKKKAAGEVLNALHPLQVRVLRCKSHKKSITCAAVTTDSKALFSGSKDGVIVKWCLEKGAKVCATKKGAAEGAVLALAVSHDSKTLASGDEGNLIRVWDPDTLAHRFDFKGHRGGVTGLAFCRFTGTLYSASRDRTLKVWSVEDRAYVETLFGHQTPITALDLLAKDRVLTSGGSDYSLRLWKIPEESQLIFNAPPRSIDSVKRLDNKHFVSCSDGGDLSLWGVWRKKPLVNVPEAHGREEASGEAHWLVSVAALHNSDLIASGSSDGAVRLWKVADGAKALDPLAQIPLKGFVNTLLFTPDDKYLIAGVGQEHRFGRWSVIKEARNALHLITIQR